MDWANRITGTAEVDPSSLTPQELNFRRHPKRQRAVVADLLDTVGWVQDVIVNARTGHILDGHLRVELAIERQEPAIPIKYVDLDPAEEATVLATFDPVRSLAFYDHAALGELRADLGAAPPDVKGLLAELAPGNAGRSGLKDVARTVPADSLAPDAAPIPADVQATFAVTLDRQAAPATAAEIARFDTLFLRYVETRGVPFGFVGWLCDAL